MIKEVRINPEGGTISTNVKITGMVAAGYHLDLYEVNSNNVVFYYSGTNLNDDDDFRYLPNTADKNIGRVIMLGANIVSIDDDTDKKTFSVILQLYQNDTLLCEVVFDDKLDTKVQRSLIIVKLI